MMFLENVSGEQLAVLDSIIASIIARDLNAEENDLIGSFLVSIGDALALIAARQAFESKEFEIK